MGSKEGASPTLTCSEELLAISQAPASQGYMFSWNNFAHPHILGGGCCYYPPLTKGENKDHIAGMGHSWCHPAPELESEWLHWALCPQGSA